MLLTKFSFIGCIINYHYPNPSVTEWKVPLQKLSMSYKHFTAIKCTEHLFLIFLNLCIFQQEHIPVGCIPLFQLPSWLEGGGEECPPREGMSEFLTEFLIHACENITFPQLLLRTVKIYVDPYFF